MLIPRKPLSAGASFLFSLLQEASPTVRCAVDMGGTLAKVVFIEELGPQSAAAAAAAAAAAGSSSSFSRRDPQLTARAYASNCDAALDLASPLLTIRGLSSCDILLPSVSSCLFPVSFALLPHVSSHLHLLRLRLLCLSLLGPTLLFIVVMSLPLLLFWGCCLLNQFVL